MPATESTSAKLRRFVQHLKDTNQQWSNAVEVSNPTMRGEETIVIITVTHWERPGPGQDLKELHKTAYATGNFTHTQEEPLLKALTLAFGNVPELPPEEE